MGNPTIVATVSVADLLKFLGLLDRVQDGDDRAHVQITDDREAPPLGDLLTAAEASALLGIKTSTWAKRKQLGWTKQFEVFRPMGQRRYARALIERYLAGEADIRFGRRRP